MTPELKTACEVVFQEHKTSHQPITWNKDAFRGRISIGLCEKAKETLVTKNVIYFPNRAKKTITILNPAVTTAATFEEAVEMVQNRVPSLVTSIVEEQPRYVAAHVSDFLSSPVKHTHRLIKINGESETTTARVRWYMKPLFFYVLWPACAAALGVLIAYLMSEYIAMVNRP